MTDLLSEITFCDECPYSGEPNGCNRKEGTCRAYESYFDLVEENATLHERLEKAVELPAKVMIERTLVNGKFKPTQKAQSFNGRIGVVYRDETRWKGLLVDICSERTGDYEAAEARLIELKGEKK